MGDSTVTSSAPNPTGDLVRLAQSAPAEEGRAILAPTPPNPQVDATEWTARICRYCRRYYAAPKGSRPHACGRCAPTIMDAIEETAAPTSGAESAEPPRHPQEPLVTRDADLSLPEIAAPAHWTEAQCVVHPGAHLAEVLVEGEPMCIQAADDWLDRIEAIAAYPALRELLPSPEDR